MKRLVTSLTAIVLWLAMVATLVAKSDRLR